MYVLQERCLKKTESCPDGYYYEWVGPQEQGPLKPLAGKSICRKCHPRCKKCTAYGFHEQVRPLFFFISRHPKNCVIR